MPVWVKCVECSGQGVFLSCQLLAGNIQLPSACQPLGSELQDSPRYWLETHEFSKHFKRCGDYWCYRGERLAMKCPVCSGRGRILQRDRHRNLPTNHLGCI